MQYIYHSLLSRRLSLHHPQLSKIQDEFARLEAGRYGEARLLRELEDLPDDITWFTNFQCYSLQNAPHQIDFLVLTPTCAIILEVKNISGFLSYQTSPQEFHRTRADGTVDHFRNPFDQAYRHQLMLEQYFTRWRVELHILYAVVMTNTNARLDASFGKLPIFHVSYLRKFIRNSLQQLPLAHVEIQQLQHHLEDIAVTLPVRKLVEVEDVRCGILCNVCNEVMRYQNGMCICATCGEKSRTGIQEAMRDYRMLVGDRISNKEFRRFTGIDCVYTASKILMRLGYEKFGKNRGVYYIIPEVEEF